MVVLAILLGFMVVCWVFWWQRHLRLYDMFGVDNRGGSAARNSLYLHAGCGKETCSSTDMVRNV